MEVDILLIGNGLTGEVKMYDYPNKKFLVTEVTVQSANAARVFDVVLHEYNGKTYAIGIGKATDSLQVESLIDTKQPKPIPGNLL
ncbi:MULTISPECIES: hypothetical protein [Leclercia]|uniref:Uncharacterized protein n=1 Tax=Leclercia pneumoniae TaxID=2815358 RepID=A0ABX8K1M7_9ENTR|nr:MULTISPECIES: hypothetical protein [Leclercia]QSW33796.1 hypothetical protein JZ655_11725 [Leclercia pneumoniae]QWW81278.1 hypothetical protein KQ929_08785 [Leclercia pneumoniae]